LNIPYPFVSADNVHELVFIGDVQELQFWNIPYPFVSREKVLLPKLGGVVTDVIFTNASCPFASKLKSGISVAVNVALIHPFISL
jgi:hypothetical protein